MLGDIQKKWISDGYHIKYDKLWSSGWYFDRQISRLWILEMQYSHFILNITNCEICAKYQFFVKQSSLNIWFFMLGVVWTIFLSLPNHTYFDGPRGILLIGSLETFTVASSLLRSGPCLSPSVADQSILRVWGCCQSKCGCFKPSNYSVVDL
jgi:hypothetical protein